MSQQIEKEVFALKTESGIISVALKIYAEHCEKMDSPQAFIDEIRYLETKYRSME